MRRRRFLRTFAIAGATALTGLSPLSRTVALLKSENTRREEDMIPKRSLGKTGEELSIIGIGGIMFSGMEQPKANRLMGELIDLGINYIDVAPSYGNAEEVIGPALEGYRKKVFLASKTEERTRDGTVSELHESLKRLRTDYLDLYQLHALNSPGDVEEAFGPGGAMEAFVKAKKEGLVRYLGFSAHSVQAALEAMKRFDFDTILFPINFVLYFKEDFGPQVVKAARDKGMGIMAIKAMARSKRTPGEKTRDFPKCWYQPTSDPREANLAVRFTLSQPITSAVPPGEELLFQMALDAAGKFTPVTPEEREELRALAEGLEPIFRFRTGDAQQG